MPDTGADVTEDVISIEITADGKSAVSELDAVDGKLKELKASISDFGNSISESLSGVGFKQLSDSIGDLSKATESLTKIGGASESVGGLATSLRELSGVEPISQGTIDNIQKYADALSKLESANGVGSLASGLSNLPQALRDMDSASVNTESLTKKLDAIATASQKASSVGSRMGSLGSGVKNLAIGLKYFDGMGDTSKSIGNITNAVGDLSEKLMKIDGLSGADGVAVALKNLASGIRGIYSAAGQTGNGSRLAQMAEEIGAFANSVVENVSPDTLQKLSQLADALEKVNSAYSKVGAAQRAVSGARGSGTQAYSKVLAVAQGIATVMGKVSSAIQNGTVRAFGALNQATQTYLSLLGRVVMVPLDSVRAKISSITSAMDGLLATIGRIVLYRALRGVLTQIVNGITTGIQNLYQWALITGNTFAGTMDSMASSMQYFQNTVGGAASELLDALAPALSQIIDAVASAINALNQLLAALTGHSTWRKAVKVQTQFADAANGAAGAAGDASDAAGDMADSTGDIADSTDKATQATKDYENTVLGFDELNKLNPVTETGGSSPKSGKGKSGKGRGGKGGNGGASGPAYELMYEDVPIDSWYKDLANTDDWTKLGEKVADAINQWNKSIDWDGIDRTAAEWSKRVWTSFNGFVDKLDWSTVGYTIARGVNVGLHFIDDIAQNADFTKFGAGIAQALNEAVNTIDATALGHVMTDKLKVALEMLHGFLYGEGTYDSMGIDFSVLQRKMNQAIDAAFSNIDWDTAISDVTNGLGKVGVTFVSGINEVIANIDSVVQNYDWNTWGILVAEYLNQAVQNIDWAGVGRFLTDGLKMAFDALHGFLQEFDWDQFGNDIATMITNGFNNVDWSQAGTDVNSLANHLLDVIEQAFGSINWDDIQNFIDGLDIPQLLSRALGDIISGCFTVMINLAETNAWPLLLAWIVGKMATLGITIAKEILKWKLMEAALSQGTGVGGSLVGGVTTTLANSGIGETVAQWIIEHMGAQGTMTAAGSVGSGIGLALLAAFGLTTNISAFNDQMQNGFTPMNFAGTMASASLTGAAIGGAFAGPVGAGVGALVGAAAGAVETLIANWGPVSDWVSQHVGQPLSDTFSWMGQNIKDFVDGSAQQWSTFGQQLSDAWNQTQQSLQDCLSGFVQWVQDHVPQPVKDVFSGIVDFFHDTFAPTPAEAKEYGSDTGQGLSDGMDEKRQNVSDSATQLAQKIRDGINGAVSNAGTWGGNVSKFVSNGIGDFSGNVSSSASDLANKIRSGIGPAVSNAGGWGSSVSQYLAGGIGSMAGGVSSAAGNISSTVGNILGTIWHSATSWGSDIATSIASGLRSGINYVANAARDVANTISSYIHFSEPDIGPLSDFHTYMPDMIRLMASGIDSSLPTLIGSLRGVAGEVSAYVRNDMATSLSDAASGIFDGSWGSLSTNALSGIGLSGNLVADGSRLFGTIVGLSGRNDSYDPDTVVSTIIEAVERGMMSVVLGTGHNDSTPQTIVLRVDSEDLARAVVRGRDRLSQRFGNLDLELT